jgi:tetratricopeptide (TPR) repeat protein
MMKRTMMLMLMLMMSIHPGYAGDADLLFEAGNRAYLDGDWGGALDKWLQIEGMGYQGGTLFYNIGNAYYKKSQLGESILYWEKAAQILGEDSDIAANLKIARAGLADKLDEQVRLPVWDWFDNFRARFSSGFISWVAVLLSFLTFGTLAIRRWVWRGALMSARLKVAAIGLAVLLALDLGMIALKMNDESSRRMGVFLTPEAEVLSAPAIGSGKLLFTLHEGTKVRVVRSLEGWYEITAGKDKQGWVKAETIGVF